MSKPIVVIHYHQRGKPKAKKEGFWKSMGKLAAQEAIGVTDKAIYEVAGMGKYTPKPPEISGPYWSKKKR